MPGAGLEPAANESQVVDSQRRCKEAVGRVLQIHLQITGQDSRDLAQLVESWPRLPGTLKAAILAIAGSVESSEKGSN